VLKSFYFLEWEPSPVTSALGNSALVATTLPSHTTFS
jgi:hypothetical protein